MTLTWGCNPKKRSEEYLREAGERLGDVGEHLGEVGERQHVWYSF